MRMTLRARKPPNVGQQADAVRFQERDEFLNRARRMPNRPDSPLSDRIAIGALVVAGGADPGGVRFGMIVAGQGRFTMATTRPGSTPPATTCNGCKDVGIFAPVKRSWRIPVWVAIYLAVVAFAHLADRLILFPSTAEIPAGAAVRTFIPFENGQLEIWTAQSQLAQSSGQADAYVLRFYGNADRADRWVADEAEAWNERAIEI